MTSRTSPRFRRMLAELPQGIRRLAIAKYRRWLQGPFAPGFHFKEIRSPVWSVRINQKYRALGKRHGEMIVWFLNWPAR